MLLTVFFQPYVAFIQTKDENNQRNELPLVFVSREEEYLKAKAIEFCLENYQLLAIQDINALQTTCVDTVLSKVVAQISDGKLSSFQEIVQRSIAQQQQHAEKVAPVERLNEGTTIGEKDIYHVAGTRSSYTVIAFPLLPLLLSLTDLSHYRSDCTLRQESSTTSLLTCK